MRAIQLKGPGTVQAAEVPDPAPGAGQVLVRVTAAGVCQSDIHIRHSPELVPSGLVLGHEIAGEVVELGAGVGHIAVGDQIVVHPVWSCGVCHTCIAGLEPACRNTGGRFFPAPTPGFTVNGGMAEYVAVPAGAAVPANGLDPAFAAVLPDAGLVPYHSIAATRAQLRPGSTAVVIGIGGLGQFAVEILRFVTGATVIALDVRDVALQAVQGRVAHTFRSDDPDVAERILGLTAGYGADVVLDLVGISETLALAGGIVAPFGTIRVPGLGGGTFSFETSLFSTSLPFGASITRPYSGTHQDLRDLVALARTRPFEVTINRYPFDEAVQAFDDLEAGKIVGRAVLLLDKAS